MKYIAFVNSLNRHVAYSVCDMKSRLAAFAILALPLVTMDAQCVLSLDSCRALAIANNKELLISGEKVNAAHYNKKAAFTNYLPELSASGGYIRNQRELSLLSDAQKSALSGLGTTVGGAITQAGQVIAQSSPEIAQQLAPLFQVMQGQLVPTFDAVGQTLVDALRTDTRNIFAGAITLTQPLYMGGKIRAYNKITNYAEQLAEQQHNTGMQEVILSTDQVYWQVVSLVNKKKLAEGYLKLLRQMDGDVQKMIKEGVATKADGLTVSVKLNEAEMTLTKVDDGLSLSRMLLCQLCGLDLSTDITLVDEQMDDLPLAASAVDANVDFALSNRPELRSLELATRIYHQKVNVTRASHLPSIALLGSLSASNPSVFNSFEKRFKGMWSVGVMVNVPIWHWGEGYYQVKAAKSEAKIAQYQLDDAKEKIELQVNQASFKVKEAEKKLIMADKNREKADENLRMATLGFQEGVIPTNNLLEAQTAWLSAQSDKIDAQIDVRLTDVCLRKALGTLGK
jgi:outer membrane protein TolC